MVEVTAWTFPSQGDEVGLVLIRPIADRCGFAQHSKCILGAAQPDARSLSLSQPVTFISVSSRSTAGRSAAQRHPGAASTLT